MKKIVACLIASSILFLSFTANADIRNVHRSVHGSQKKGFAAGMHAGTTTEGQTAQASHDVNKASRQTQRSNRQPI